jgi:hypothetical protein
MIKVECKYLDGRKCVHPEKPFGDHPLMLRCLNKCDKYDGPERNPVTANLPAKAGAGAGCTPCAAAAKAKRERRQIDAAEARRTLDEAMNADGESDPQHSQNCE